MVCNLCMKDKKKGYLVSSSSYQGKKYWLCDGCYEYFVRLLTREESWHNADLMIRWLIHVLTGKSFKR